jgi:hypothetical protein
VQLARLKRLQEEQRQRDRRLRATPVYRELTEFAARTRKRQRNNRRLLDDFDHKLFEVTGKLLAGNNLADKDRDELKRQLVVLKQDQDREKKRLAGWKDRVEEQISQLRARVKERLHAYPGVGPAAWKAFDLLVDRELDNLWKDLQKAEDEDDLTAGL